MPRQGTQTMQFHSKIKEKISKAKTDPQRAMSYVLSLVRGSIFSFNVRLLRRRIKIGNSLRLRSTLHVNGPGKVILGRNVTADISFLRTPSIITHTKESLVIIGDGTYLGGTRISCVGKIKIGREGLFGSTTIIDSDIIPTKYTSIDEQWIEQYVAPIEIGDHFWAGTNAFILKGTKIGNECVLGAGGLIYDKTFPDRSLLIGNPARKIGSTR